MYGLSQGHYKDKNGVNKGRKTLDFMAIYINKSFLAGFYVFGRLSLALVMVLFLCQPAKAQTDNDNMPQWGEHNEQSVAVIDHSIWNRILKTYVETDTHGQNLFNYAAVLPADKRALKHYLEALSLVPLQNYNRNEQLAFWINVYNALLTNVILEAYPVDTILDIGGDLFSRGPWKDKLFSKDGVLLSVNDIEKAVIPYILRDYRIVFALSCGAIGCPNIGSKALSGKYVEGYLESATLAFVNGPTAIFEFDDSNVKISKYYHWNKSEFERANITVLEHLKSYAMGDLAQKLEKTWYIGGYGFNWHLNEVKPQ